MKSGKFKVTAQKENYITNAVIAERVIAEDVSESEMQSIILKKTILSEGEYFCIYSNFQEITELYMSALDIAESEEDNQEERFEQEFIF